MIKFVSYTQNNYSNEKKLTVNNKILTTNTITNFSSSTKSCTITAFNNQTQNHRHKKVIFKNV